MTLPLIFAILTRDVGWGIFFFIVILLIFPISIFIFIYDIIYFSIILPANLPESILWTLFILPIIMVYGIFLLTFKKIISKKREKYKLFVIMWPIYFLVNAILFLFFVLKDIAAAIAIGSLA